jgi:hypothetical protein
MNSSYETSEQVYFSFQNKDLSSIILWNKIWQMNHGTNALFDNIPHFKTKVYRSSYDRTTYDKRIVLIRLPIEHIPHFKRKLYCSWYDGITHDNEYYLPKFWSSILLISNERSIVHLMNEQHTTNKYFLLEFRSST